MIVTLLMLLSAVVTLVATDRAIAWARRRQLLDEINERSSHRVPTPRMGGVGIMAGVTAGTVGYCLWQPGDAVPALWILAGAAGAFGLGLWDDMRNPPAWQKFAAQIALAAVVAGFGIAPVAHLPQPAAALAAFAWMLLMMNVVNFMDGINGLAGRFAQVCGFAYMAVGMTTGTGPLFIFLSIQLIAVAAGFLYFNLPKARTFMGDSGSQQIGMYLALLSLLPASALESPFPIAFTAGLLLVPAIFVFDVLETVQRRARAGETIWKAHRTHLYQLYLIARGEAHDATRHFVIGHCIAAALAGAALAIAAVRFPELPARALVPAAVVVVALAMASYWMQVKLTVRSSASQS